MCKWLQLCSTLNTICICNTNQCCLFQDKDKLQKSHLLEQEKLVKDLDKEKISAKKKGEKELKKAEKKGYVSTDFL